MKTISHRASIIIAAAFLGGVGLIQAQQTPVTSAQAPQGNWEAVRGLPVDQSIRVDGDHMGRTCDFLAADDATLTCKITRSILFFPVTQRIVYPRAGVRRVRISRQTRSGLTGLAIGAGIGVVLGAIFDSQAGDESGPLSVGKHTTGIFYLGFIGALFGENIGRGLDFRAGPEVYRAP